MPPFIGFQHSSFIKAKLWVLANQSGRRNLTGFQKIEVILKFKDTLSSKAKANQQASGGSVRLKSDKPIHTYKMLAQLAGVSHGTIRQAEYILACADEQDIEALRKGTKKINRIYNKYKKPTRSIERTTTQPDNVPSYPDELVGQIGLIIDTLDDIGNEFSQKEYRKYIVSRVREWLKSKTAD